jgi:leader peptidase (prepilin peptidase)/N-methyltransferase
MRKSRDVRTVLSVIGALALAVTWLGGLGLRLALVALALAPLVMAGHIDVQIRRLPNRLLGSAALPAGLAVALAYGWTSVAALSAILGIAATAGPLLALHLINPSGMGFGDVKLGVVLGLLVSTADWRLGLAVLLIASLGSALWCLTRSQSSIAFGPPLIGSLVLVLVTHGFGLPHLLPDPFVRARS